MLKLLLLVAQLVAFVFGAALPEERVYARDAVTPPSEDPFYTPDDGYEKEEPGTILRWRHAPQMPAFTVFKQNLNASIQILYRTTDTQGQPTATVVTVMIPHNHAEGKLLSYQSWEDSAWINCAPSYAIQFGANPQGIISQVDMLTLQSALNEGWIVSTPDYEGPKSSFTSAIISGQATLDSIRAVLKSESFTGVKPDSKVAMWGYSGGSIASGWAAALQPTYAPELKIAGAALGGVIQNITSVAVQVNKGPFVGLVPAGIKGLSSQYPELEDYINDQLLPDKRDDFEKAGKQCLSVDVLTYAFQDWFSYTKAGDRVLYNETIQKVLDENAMGKQKPQIPLLFYHGVHDEVMPIADVDKLYYEYCSNGVTVEYYREEGSEHVLEMITGFPKAYNYVKNLLDGGSVSSGCQRHDVFSNAFDEDALPTYSAEIWGILKGLLGAPVGPAAIS
uniref:ARAD1D09636p n=1 Tax=Blastobotrys adeninivorans TaxID=409370 RepID=Q5GMI6_BLAAD|nr:extracellular lipase [Blastobotrys adeninivorans]